VIFLDSWVWLEFFQEDERADRAEAVIEQIGEERAVVAPTVLMEVRYQIKRRYGDDKADRVVTAITGFDSLDVVPTTAEVGLYAADLRDRYYRRSDRAISYADAIHIATADLTGCDTLYTGDSDFEDVDEVDVEIV